VASIMAGVANVAPSIARFVAMEVIERFRAALRYRSVIAVMRIVAVIDVAVEAVRAMEQRACPEEHAAHEPVGTIVAVRRAVKGSVVKVAVRAYRGCADTDCHLCWSRRGPAYDR